MILGQVFSGSTAADFAVVPIESIRSAYSLCVPVLGSMLTIVGAFLIYRIIRRAMGAAEEPFYDSQDQDDSGYAPSQEEIEAYEAQWDREMKDWQDFTGQTMDRRNEGRE